MIADRRIDTERKKKKECIELQSTGHKIQLFRFFHSIVQSPLPSNSRTCQQALKKPHRPSLPAAPGPAPLWASAPSPPCSLGSPILGISCKWNHIRCNLGDWLPSLHIEQLCFKSDTTSGRTVAMAPKVEEPPQPPKASRPGGLAQTSRAKTNK